MLISSHHEASSWWMLYVREILNKGEQTHRSAREVLRSVLPDSVEFAVSVLEQGYPNNLNNYTKYSNSLWI